MCPMLLYNLEPLWYVAYEARLKTISLQAIAWGKTDVIKKLKSSDGWLYLFL